MSKIKKVHTSCKDCCFGVYNDIGSKTQENCVLNLLEYYKEQKTEILEAYNEDNEFYIINGRKCYFKRNKDWYNNLELANKKDYIKKVFDETHIKYMAIIIADDDLFDIKLTLSSILEQNPKPSFIVVIKKFNSTIDTKELNKILINTGKKWRVSKPSSPEVTPQIIINNLIDIFARDYSIYIQINTGKVFFKNEIQRINDLIIYDDFKFGLINVDENIKIGHSFLHKILRGNFPKEIIKEIPQ